jgi:phage baseplate assembly protein gpV
MRNAGALANAIRMQALLAGNRKTGTKQGTLTSYDPANYCAKVLLQPEGFETGWLPIATIGAGNGCGIQVGPTIGLLCDVEFTEGDKDNGKVTKFYFNDVDRPIAGVQAGQIAIQDSSGNSMKFDPASNSLAILSGTFSVTANGGDVVINGISHINHVHGGVQRGDGTTDKPQ